jgi:hypothetical protein
MTPVAGVEKQNGLAFASPFLSAITGQQADK